MLWADSAHPLGPGICISSLSVSQALCAMGSEDGYLRLWSLDFSSVLLEAGGTMKPSWHQSCPGRVVFLGHTLARRQSQGSRGSSPEPGSGWSSGSCLSYPTESKEMGLSVLWRGPGRSPSHRVRRARGPSHFSVHQP